MKLKFTHVKKLWSACVCVCIKIACLLVFGRSNYLVEAFGRMDIWGADRFLTLHVSEIGHEIVILQSELGRKESVKILAHINYNKLLIHMVIEFDKGLVYYSISYPIFK